MNILKRIERLLTRLPVFFNENRTLAGLVPYKEFNRAIYHSYDFENIPVITRQ